MQARMKNPAMILTDAMPAIMALAAATRTGGVPPATLELTHLRASQINDCAACLHGGTRSAAQAGVTDEQMADLAEWQDSPRFDAAEKAALGLTEAVTRLADRTDPVPDAVWDEAAAHYDERGLASLVLFIATTNVFNRLNVATRQVPGEW